MLQDKLQDGLFVMIINFRKTHNDLSKTRKITVIKNRPSEKAPLTC